MDNILFNFVEIFTDICMKVYSLLYVGMPMVLNWFVTKFGEMDGMEFIADEMGLAEYTPLELMLGVGLVVTLVAGILSFFKKLATPL